MRNQRGIGLIEVLVAVLILSIGLLGIAMVQTRALANNNSAMGRSMATVASYSILDAMRADRDNAVTAGTYNGTITADDCPDEGSFAETQLHKWCAELGQTLGIADTTKGTIACADTGICTVTVQFDDSKAAENGSGTQQTTSVITKAML
ncbi:type IV pilus modification protein PilV [Solimonas marina]|uniref:type IV pilus modification protein PilV n=1 Tax=Solimonas marina TaxID=2714601 RepID=UPI0019D06F89|nr:type IV pilus modification protein PilV [Solimonas marina]